MSCRTNLAFVNAWRMFFGVDMHRSLTRWLGGNSHPLHRAPLQVAP